MTPRLFCAALALVGLTVTAACATGSASTTEDPADATPDDAAPTPTGTVPRDASAPESGGEASTQGLRRPGAGEVVFKVDLHHLVGRDIDGFEAEPVFLDC